MSADYHLLSDFRVLRLALHLEETFEKYEVYLRDMIPEAPVRAHLRMLFEGGPHHKELREVHDALLKQAGDIEGNPLQTDQILQTLLECERGAHQFYLHELDNLSDPRLVDLFRALADEELQHVHAVDGAILLLQSLRKGSGRSVELSRGAAVSTSSGP